MKTVPTLCATATVVGASAVGLSFGREAPFDSAHSSKRKTTPARELASGPMPTAVQTQTAATTSTTPTSSHYAPIPIAPATRMPVSSQASQDGRSQRRIVRRKTSDDAALQVQLPPRPSSMVYSYAPSDQGTTESEPAVRLPTRRPSWMRRLSAISNSQHPSRNPSPTPLSPSLSYSNGSMAFSNDGSTAPMVGRRSASPLPPNKLVKRSSSVRVPREAPSQGSVSLRPSFRRPATSHQRSATLQHHPALLEMTAEDPSVNAQLHSAAGSTDGEVEYTQYFTAKVAKGRALAKRRGLTANANVFRRVFPDEKHTPTLVLARSVSASAEEMDESTTDDGESVFFVSRPGTPLSITAVFASKQERFQPRPQPSPTEAADDAVRPRRSFSITDFLSGARRQRPAKVQGPPLSSSSSSSAAAAAASSTAASTASRLTRGFSQRASSAPLLPTMRRRPNSASYGDARRDLTDPGLPTRSIATSAGIAASGAARTGDVGGSQSSPLPAAPVRRASGVAQDPLAQLEVIAPAAAPANQQPPSPTLAQSGVRPSRHSTAPSEQASTLVGSSDNENRGLGSGDEDDADIHSETLFDSLRTGATRSTSGGARGPRIETIFDESPPSKVRVTALRDLLPPGSFGEHTPNGAAGQHSIAEEEESISTPVRTVRAERSLQDSPSCSRGLSAPLIPTSISASPPSMPKPLSLGTLEWDPRTGDDDDSSRWSLDEEDVEDSWVDLPPVSHIATPISLSRQNPRLLPSGPSSKATTPQHLTADHPDRDARSSIFDWSEQQIADKNSGSHSPPRPRTVHGKKDADHRGSRSVGRRVPSGLHARSQSVPVVPDAAGKRSTVVTNKFGTWGVGSKGVTEDWNDDFDFSELAEEPTTEGAKATPKVDSASVMVVPKSIQEQQNNVLANIGLLREWGLLIEELKEHRVRAAALDLVNGPNSGMWEEVDAMIDLADQEAEHENVARMSPPSTPGFDEDAFDEAPHVSPSNGRARRKSGSPNDEINKTPTTQSTHPRRSILPSQYGVFSPQSSPVPPKSRFETPPRSEQKPIITRPRKDSEAKARSVIEALQSKRKSIIDSVPNAPPTPSTKKVPFDTATLRRIVPYVNTLTRKVKDTIREAEGLYSSPHASPMNEEPSFSKMFQQDADLAAQMKLMTVM